VAQLQKQSEKVDIARPLLKMETPLFRALLLLGIIAALAPGVYSESEDMNSDTTGDSPTAAPLLYPAPDGEEPSAHYTLKVDGRPVFVYQARVSAKPVNRVWDGRQRPLEQTELAAFAYWDMSKPVQVEISSARTVENVTVRPQSLGILPNVDGNTISFPLAAPANLVVEVNDIHHALHLFANPPDESSRMSERPRVHYFGPGVHEPGDIVLESNETVYIAGGAVVHGVVRAARAENIRVLGRGVLDGSKVERRESKNLLWFYECRNVLVSGIILRDPPVWAVLPKNCDGVWLSNVKLIGCWRYNSDGFDFVDCRDVHVSRCFVRSYDDSIVVKSFNEQGDDIQDVTVEDCVIWTDWGFSLGVTYETRTARIRDLVFRNCDVIHNIVWRGTLAINPSDRAEISNVLFENIRVEDARTGLIELAIEETQWGTDDERGNIRGVVFKDITVTGGPFPSSVIRGYDETHGVGDVTIENLVIHGKQILNPEDGRFQIGPHVKNVTFAP